MKTTTSNWQRVSKCRPCPVCDHPDWCLFTPPAGVKDARAWKQHGATAADVQTAVDAAPVRKLVVKTSVRKRKVGTKHGS
jgi:hypothetical protein